MEIWIDEFTPRDVAYADATFPATDMQCESSRALTVPKVHLWGVRLLQTTGFFCQWPTEWVYAYDSYFLDPHVRAQDGPHDGAVLVCHGLTEVRVCSGTVGDVVQIRAMCWGAMRTRTWASRRMYTCHCFFL